MTTVRGSAEFTLGLRRHLAFLRGQLAQRIQPAPEPDPAPQACSVRGVSPPTRPELTDSLSISSMLTKAPRGANFWT